MPRDEDLTTPEHLLHLPVRLDAGDIGSVVAQKMVEILREPENRAYLAGSVLVPLMVFRGKNVPLIPFMVVGFIGAHASRMAYRSYKNLEIIAQAAQDVEGS